MDTGPTRQTRTVEDDRCPIDWGELPQETDGARMLHS